MLRSQAAMKQMPATIKLANVVDGSIKDYYLIGGELYQITSGPQTRVVRIAEHGGSHELIKPCDASALQARLRSAHLGSDPGLG